MATLDDSPSLFAGKSWTLWAEKVGGNTQEKQTSGTAPERPHLKDDSMKLKKEDMALYGLCPAQDEFFLVVCECCGQVVKPQAFKTHMEQRHGTMTKLVVPSLSSRSPIKTHPRSAPIAKSHSVPQKPDKPGRPPPVHTSLRPLGPHRSSSAPLSERTADRTHRSGDRHSSSSLDKHDRNHRVHMRSGLECSEAVVKVERMQLSAKKGNSSCNIGNRSGGISGMAAINVSTNNGNGHSSGNDAVVKAHEHAKIAPKVTLSSQATKPILIKPEPHPLSAQKQTAGWKPIGPAETSIPRRLSDLKTEKLVEDIKPALPVSSAPVSMVTTTTTTTAAAMTTSVTSLVKTSNPTTVVNVSTPTTPTTPSVNTVSEQIATMKKFEKERLLPCKDREFNPDKHCGVFLPELGKACTRSLTCKSHALSLRRAVSGRRLPFDELLKEHKQAKEVFLRAKAEGSAGLPAKRPSASNATSASVMSVSQTGITSPTSSVLPSQPHPMVKSPTSSVSHSAVKHSKPLPKPQLSPRSPAAVFPKDEPILLPESCSRLSSDAEDDEEMREKPDYPYLPFHPRPAAVNTFGGWQHGRGCYMFSRKQDLLRAAFMAAVERHLHPPPHKKLCVESKLPQGSQIMTNKEDPYEFMVGEHGNLAAARNHHAAVLAQQGRAVNPAVHSARPVAVSQPSRPIAISQPNRPANKSKSKSTSSLSSSSAAAAMAAATASMSASVANRPVKPKDGSGGRSPLGSPVLSRSASSSSSSSSSAKRKRSGSSSGGNAAAHIAAQNVGVFNPNAAAAANVNPLSITVPGGNMGNINLNLNSATLSNINAAINTSKAGQLKDVSIVVTNIEHGEPNLINGQLVSIAGGNLADVTQLQLNSVQDKSAKFKGSIKPGASSSRQQTIKTSVPMDAQQATNINAIMAAIPGSTVVMDTGQPAGTLIAPGSLAMVTGSLATTATSASLAGASSTPQPSPSTTPSPLVRSDSASPQVCSASPLPNGVIPSPQTFAFKAFPTPGQVNSAGGGTGDAGADISLSLAPGTIMDPNLQPQFSQHGQQQPIATLVAKTSGKPVTSSTYPPPGNMKRSNSSPGLKPALSGATLRTPLSAAQAQRLAAAALNLNTQTGQLVGPGNIAYGNQVLGAAAAQLTSLQLQPKGPLGKGAVSMGKLPAMQPLSLTIVTPSGVPMATPSHQPQAYILQSDDHSGKEVTPQLPPSPSNAVS